MILLLSGVLVFGYCMVIVWFDVLLVAIWLCRCTSCVGDDASKRGVFTQPQLNV